MSSIFVRSSFLSLFLIHDLVNLFFVCNGIETVKENKF